MALRRAVLPQKPTRDFTQRAGSSTKPRPSQAAPPGNPPVQTLTPPIAAPDEARRFRKGVLFSLLRYGVLVTVGFGYAMISARLLGVEVVGIIALMTGILGILRPLTSLGEQFALVPALNKHGPTSSQATTLYWTTVGLSVLTTLVLSVPYGLFAVWMLNAVYHQGQYWPWLLVFMVGFYSIYNLVLLFSAPFQAFQEMKHYAVVELLSGMAKVGLLVILVYFLGATPAAGVWAQVTGFSVSALLLFLYMPRFFKARLEAPRWHTLKADLKGVYTYSLKSLPANAGISILQHADRLTIGFFCPVAQLGIYSYAYALFERILMMGTSYENMVFSSTSRLAQGQQRAMVGDIYRSALLTSFYWLCPVVALFIGFGDSILSLFGRRFMEGHATLSLLLVGVLCDNFSRISTGLFSGLNHPGLRTGTVVTGALINLCLNLLLVPHMGILGAATANTLGYFCSAAQCGWWLRRFPEIKALDAQFTGHMLWILSLNALLLGLLVWIQRLMSPWPLVWALGITGLFGWCYWHLGRRWGIRLR